MKTENLLTFEDYISPLIHVIIKNETEIITNKIYPKNLSFKSILLSEGLSLDINYKIQNNEIDINKSLIELVPKNAEDLTNIELIIESEDILDTSENEPYQSNNENIQYKILCPYEKPFRILSFNPQDNNVAIKKYDKETLSYFGLDKFSLSKSSYCNSLNDLYISNGENNNYYKISNIKLNIEKLEDIPWPKKYHSMIYIPKKYIYFIGGDSRATFYYDFINKIFKLWAPLKFIEKYPGLIYFNKTYIYAFGHQKKLDDLNFIERTNIKRKPNWELIDIKLCEPFNLKRFGAVLSNDDKIYFVGGKSARTDKIFIFDLKNNEISKTTQINSAMRINESNFYNINEFTSVILPRETNGDIKIIAFNHRTKKFRKLRYERDYDLINVTNTIELNDNNSSNDNMKISAEIKFKKLENKFEKEKFEVVKESEEDLKMPNLSEIKKLLLGDKNILNKNVEAMIFNRKRIKNKKVDKIVGDDSEDEYYLIPDFDEDDNSFFKNEKNDIVIDVEEDNEKINLRGVPKGKKENNIDINKGSILRNMFEQDIEQDIDILKVKNPRITLEDYKNLIYFNRLTSSYIQYKPTNSINISLENVIGTKNQNNTPFKLNNESRYYFDLTGKKRNSSINENQPNKSINKDITEIKENINNNLNNNINKNITNNINNNNNNIDETKGKIKNEIDIQDNLIIKASTPNTPTPVDNINDIKLKQNKGYNLPNSTNTDYILNATIKGIKTSIIGEKNFGKLKANDTYKSLTLKELFGGDVDDEFILNSGTIVVPGEDLTNKQKKDIKEDEKDIKNKPPKYEFISGIIEGTGKNKNNLNIVPKIDNKKTLENKSEVNIKTKIPELDINKKKSYILNNEMNKGITLKELCNKDIYENINLNIINHDLWGYENNIFIGTINKKSINDLDIKVSKPKFNVNNISDINQDIKIPDIDLNNNKEKYKPNKTVKEIFGEDIDENIDLIVIKPYLWSTDHLDLVRSKIELKQDIDLPNEVTNIPRTSDLENAEISIYTEIKPCITLKEEFGKNIDDNISLNIYQQNLIPNEIDLKLSDNKDITFKNSNNNEINVSEINIPDIKLKGKKPKTEINENIPSVDINNNINIERPKIDVSMTGNIPGMEINLNKNNEFNPSITLRDICNEDIETPIYLNIKNHKLEPNKEYIIPDNKKNEKKVEINKKEPDISRSVNINPENKIPRYETMIGEIPGKNLNKSRFEVITGIIPGRATTGRKTESPNKKTDLKGNLSINKQTADTDKSNINLVMDGTKVKGKKSKFDVDNKLTKQNVENVGINEITLKEIFGKDINDNIQLKVINPELWGTDNYDSSGLIDGQNNNLNLQTGRVDLKTSDINTPQFTLTGSINKKKEDNNKEINGKVSGNIPEIQLNKPEININIEKPKLEPNIRNKYDYSLTLKEIFANDINDDIQLNIIKPELWDIDAANYNTKGMIYGKMDLIIPSASINFKQPSITVSNINPNIDLNANINKPKIDMNIKDNDSIPSLDINEKQVNNDNKLRGPKINTQLKKTKVDKNDNNKNGNPITLKEVFNEDVNDKIVLKVINPKLWDSNEFNMKSNIHRSVNFRFPKRNVDMNDPNIDNILNYSLKSSFNKPNFDNNIKAGGKMMNQSVKVPDYNMNIPNLNSNVKKPELDINKGGLKFKNNMNKVDKDTITLKEIFNGDINDKIQLKVINPELWGINNYDIPGLITGNNQFEFPKDKINIEGPNIKIPNNFLNINNQQNIDIDGDIKGMNFKNPNKKINLKAPKGDANINMGGIKVGANIKNPDEIPITLKDLFNKEIDDDIFLKIIKPDLWGNDNFSTSGVINGNLDFEFPKDNINLKKPNISSPNYSLDGNINIKKPKIEAKLKGDLSQSIPSLEINQPDANVKVSENVKKPELNKPNLNANLPVIKFDINDKNKDEKLVTTLKEIFDKDIDENINLKVINPHLWGNDIEKDNNNSKLPTSNINMSGPKFDVPDIDIEKRNIKADINWNIPDFKLDVNKPELNNNLNISGKKSSSNIPEISIENEMKNIITLKEEFGKDVDDNIINLKIPKHILYSDSSNLIPDINKKDINLKLQVPEINKY